MSSPPTRAEFDALAARVAALESPPRGLTEAQVGKHRVGCRCGCGIRLAFPPVESKPAQPPGTAEVTCSPNTPALEKAWQSVQNAMLDVLDEFAPNVQSERRYDEGRKQFDDAVRAYGSAAVEAACKPLLEKCDRLESERDSFHRQADVAAQAVRDLARLKQIYKKSPRLSEAEGISIDEIREWNHLIGMGLPEGHPMCWKAGG